MELRRGLTIGEKYDPAIVIEVGRAMAMKEEENGKDVSTKGDSAGA